MKMENGSLPNEHLSRNASKCQPTSPLFTPPVVSAKARYGCCAWLKRFAEKRASTCWLLAIRAALAQLFRQTVQERQLGNEYFSIRFR